MFQVNDILEVIKKPIGVKLYPGMYVRVTEVRVEDKFLRDPLSPIKMEYYTEVDVEYPVFNPIYIHDTEFRKATGIDASVFKMPSASNIANVDFDIFNRLMVDYGELNRKILDEHDIMPNLNMSPAQIMRREIEKMRLIGDFSNVELKNELMRRGYKVFNNHEIHDMSDGPKKIIFNYPATICIWPDGSKTVVKCAEGQEFSEYYGYLACLAKKLYGTNGEINRIINKNKEYGNGHEGEVKKVDGVQVGQLVNAAAKTERLREGLKEAQAAADHFHKELDNFYKRLSKLINRVPLSRGGKKILMAHMKKAFPEIFED